VYSGLVMGLREVYVIRPCVRRAVSRLFAQDSAVGSESAGAIACSFSTQVRLASTLQ
jgi:hypothetical protein